MTERSCSVCGAPVDRDATSCPWCGADLTSRGKSPDLPGITASAMPFERSLPRLTTPHEFESTPELDEYVPFRHELPESIDRKRVRSRWGLRTTAVVVIAAMIVAALGATAWLAAARFLGW